MGYKEYYIYDFTDDADAADPAGWTCGGTVQVISGLGGQTKVVEMNSNGTIYNTFTAAKISGVIEFKYRLNGLARANIELREGANLSVFMQFWDDGELYWYKNALTVEGNATYSINQWYYFKITFDCVTDTYSLEVREDDENGTAIVNETGLTYNVAATDIDDLRFAFAAAGDIAYVDDFQYSWNPNFYQNELYRLNDLIGKLSTGSTVSDYELKKEISRVAGTNRILINSGELLFSTAGRTIKRYIIELSMRYENDITDAINDITNGIYKFNTRQAITSYTRPTNMLFIEFRDGTKCEHNSQSNRWDCKIKIDVTWSTS